MRAVVAVLVALISLLALAAAAWGLPPFTTAPKVSEGRGQQAEAIRLGTGCHPAFDRLVVRARLATPGYAVRYVRRIVQDGSGRPVRLLGRKRIRVRLRDTRAHTEDGTGILLPDTVTPGCANLRQVKLAGDFEGVVTLGLGLRRRTGFRVFRLTDPTRVVIDIAH